MLVETMCMCNTFSQTIFWWEFFYQHVVEPACPKGGGEREREGENWRRRAERKRTYKCKMYGHWEK